MDFGHISDLSRVCELWDMTSVVKVDLNLPGVIYRTFDLGAQGIMVPHVALKTPALWWTPPIRPHRASRRGWQSSRLRRGGLR